MTSSNLNDGFLKGYLAVNPNKPTAVRYASSVGFARLAGKNETDGSIINPSSPGRLPVLTNLGINKALFGLGEGPLSAHYYENNVQNVVSSVKLADIRGFKYGLSNIADKKPKNVFRRDRYGQFRDMLEMAPNTAYIDDKTNVVSYPIEAQFFADDGSLISPEATSCSNLSTNLTSSAPFFDRDVVEFSDSLVVRNRGPLNNKVVDLTIEI